MSKKMLFAALASVALVGCTSDESVKDVLESQKIKFDNPAMSLKTKAPGFLGEIETSAYPNEEKFMVYAKVYTGSFNGWENSTDIKTFWEDAEETSRNAENGYWETDGDHYWPNDPYKLAFASYSPSCILNDGDVADVEYGVNGFVFTDFKVKENIEEQYDLMYSDRNVDCDKTNCLTGVPVKFSHALSSVVFGAAENVGGKEYVINSIEIKGDFVTEATFKENLTEVFADGTTPYSSSKDPQWVDPAAAVSCNFIPSFSPFTVPGSVVLFTSGESALLPIPQNVPDNAEVILNYSVTQEGSKLTYTRPIKLTDFVDASGNTIEKWDIGKRYKYVINFGGTSKIYFAPTVDLWVDGGTVSVTI